MLTLTQSGGSRIGGLLAPCRIHIMILRDRRDHGYDGLVYGEEEFVGVRCETPDICFETKGMFTSRFFPSF